jgi:hypothetical protein
MKIGITLNEVLRSFLPQLFYTYEKYIGPIELTEEDVTSYELHEFFKFEDINKFNSFLYLEAPLEIFGHADQMSDGLMNHFNDFLSEIEYDGEHQIELVSREVNKAIPATFFFLSKTGCRAENVRFVKTYKDKWNGVDVLITANPFVLESKPSDKISVKVKAPYNTDVKADYEIDSLMDFMKNDELRNKILNKITITNYEEL